MYFLEVKRHDKNIFINDSFRIIEVSKKQGISAMVGMLLTDPDGDARVQAYLFNRDKWIDKTAERWAKDNQGYALKSLIELYKEIPVTDTKEKMETKTFVAQMKVVDKDKHIARARITTETIDRDNEIILTSAWQEDLKYYQTS